MPIAIPIVAPLRKPDLSVVTLSVRGSVGGGEGGRGEGGGGDGPPICRTTHRELPSCSMPSIRESQLTWELVLALAFELMISLELIISLEVTFSEALETTAFSIRCCHPLEKTPLLSGPLMRPRVPNKA